MFYHEIIRNLPRAFGAPLAQAAFRQKPADFAVTEMIDFAFTGEGDHLCLLLEKTGLNTEDLVRCLQSALGVSAVDIGYFGLKDKHAVTRQWVSIHLPGKPARAHHFLSTPQPLGANITVLQHNWHKRKFRIGSHQANHFRIVLREFAGDVGEFEEYFQQLCDAGFPNYFGEQRFGHGAQNIHKALSLFHGKSGRISRRQRSLYLSAARSFLFNLMLAARIKEANWLCPLAGEKLLLAGSNSFFDAATEPDLEVRLRNHDIHTSAVLWGAGDGIAEWEHRAVSEHQALTSGLQKMGLKTARRALRATVSEPQLDCLDENTVALEFTLEPGCYATSLLRELCLTVS